MQKIKSVADDLLSALALVLLVAFFDALFGGAISAGLSTDDYWSQYDQFVNDVYQTVLGFAILIFAFFIWKRTESPSFVLAFILLLVGYVEDILYYVLLFVTKFQIEAFSRQLVEVKTGFPETISGWLGWMLRNIFANHWFKGFDLPFVFALNIASILGSIFILWKGDD